MATNYINPTHPTFWKTDRRVNMVWKSHIGRITWTHCVSLNSLLWMPYKPPSCYHDHLINLIKMAFKSRVLACAGKGPLLNKVLILSKSLRTKLEAVPVLLHLLSKVISSIAWAFSLNSLSESNLINGYNIHLTPNDLLPHPQTKASLNSRYRSFSL